MKLSVKFSLVISSLLFVTISLMVSINIGQNSDFLKDEIRKKGETLAHTAAIASLDPFLRNDYAALRRYCISIASDEDVNTAAILDNYYIVKMNNDIITLGESWDNKLNPLIGNYSVLTPIKLAAKNIGYVYIEMTVANIRDELEILILKNVLLGSVFTIIGIILALIMAGRITIPLNTLTKFASSVSRGQFESIPEYSSSDEVGILSNAFNLMISNLKNYIDSRTRNERLTMAGRLSSVIAHEIRNPLEPIKGAVTMLRLKNPGNQWVEKYSNIIEAEVNELSGFIGNLLDFTKQGEPDFQKLSINMLIFDIRDLTIEYIKQQNNNLVISLDEKIPESYFNPRQIKQIIMNLIMNSVHAMESKNGVIEITTQLMEDSIEISIKDNGSGIEAKNLKHLSEPYFTSRKEGTGLGLFISQLLIEKHGGSLQIESSHTNWTLAIIKLPLRSQYNK
ncbi:MAG: HAMP domain-containing protein [Spirochaetales bacterium]|nr:HAMP domain-containing protein [Spirochaetales bacterium]